METSISDRVQNIAEDFDKALGGVETDAELANIKAHFLGKKGVIGALLSSISQLSPEERKTIGRAVNQLKNRHEWETG